MVLESAIFFEVKHHTAQQQKQQKALKKKEIAMLLCAHSEPQSNLVFVIATKCECLVQQNIHIVSLPALDVSSLRSMNNLCENVKNIDKLDWPPFYNTFHSYVTF